MILFSACNKDILTEDSALAADTLITLDALPEDTIVVPDVVVDDTILLDNSRISQCREDYLTYTYDRSHRLVYINYLKRPVISTASDPASGIYMRDEFLYNSLNQLAGLVRYNMLPSPDKVNPIVKKSYTYNKSGQLTEIVTSFARLPKFIVYEYLLYDNLGNMVKKEVKRTDGTFALYYYTYDKENRLVMIKGFRGNSFVYFVCKLTYDDRNNVASKEFYYPPVITTSSDDVVRRWVVHYKYDTYTNPFRKINLPVSTLFEWMDEISPNNITVIWFSNDIISNGIFYKYKYNDWGLPILRVRTSPDIEADF
jgi:hypothetical protein